MSTVVKEFQLVQIGKGTRSHVFLEERDQTLCESMVYGGFRYTRERGHSPSFIPAKLTKLGYGKPTCADCVRCLGPNRPHS
jgi:hypothetical protein